MNDILIAIILGIVEGFTEFLPVSSTGHLILVNEFAGFDQEFSNMFNIVIQMGAIMAVVVYFWKRIWPFHPSHSQDQKNRVWDLWKKTIAGVIPAVVIGVLLGDTIEEWLFNPATVSIALLAGGILLIYIESKKRDHTISDIFSMNYATAIYIGLIQCIAMVPGTSRSAATIIGAMMLGASRLVAAEFSFFLAIPTIAGASLYSIMKANLAFTQHQVILLAVGLIVSYLVAWIVIAAFMKFISTNNFKPFGWYRIVLGVLVIGYFLLT